MLFLFRRVRCMGSGPTDGKAGGTSSLSLLCNYYWHRLFKKKYNFSTAIREAGGAFAKLEIAREEEYFYKKVKFRFFHSLRLLGMLR